MIHDDSPKSCQRISVPVGLWDFPLMRLISPMSWCPSSLAKLGYKSDFTMVYGTYNYKLPSGNLT